MLRAALGWNDVGAAVGTSAEQPPTAIAPASAKGNESLESFMERYLGEWEWSERTTTRKNESVRSGCQEREQMFVRAMVALPGVRRNRTRP